MKPQTSGVVSTGDAFDLARITVVFVLSIIAILIAGGLVLLHLQGHDITVGFSDQSMAVEVCLLWLALTRQPADRFGVQKVVGIVRYEFHRSFNWDP